MTLTLRAAITDGDTVFDVLGADDLQPGEWKTIDSEAMTIRTAKAATLAYGESARYRVSVYRGSAGTHAAAHDAGATVAAYSAGGSGLPSQWTDGGHGDVTAETDDPTTTPLTVVAPDDSDQYGIKIEAGGLGFEGGLLVVTGDQADLSGSAYIIRAVTAVDGRQVLDVDSWGSMALTADPDGGGGLTIQSGDVESVMRIVAGVDLPNSRMSVSVPLRIGNPVSPGTGIVYVKQTVAVDDSALDPGDMTLWFDQTDGAAKLKIKGKSADGTVVTGSVNLT